MTKKREKAARLYDSIQEFISDRPEYNEMTVEEFGYTLLEISSGRED